MSSLSSSLVIVFGIQVVDHSVMRRDVSTHPATQRRVLLPGFAAFKGIAATQNGTSKIKREKPKVL
ncbi:MAG TPA: hypothetical protein VGC26_12155 [Afipia sp.]